MDFAWRILGALMYMQALAMLSVARFFPGSEQSLQERLIAADQLMKYGNPFKRK